MSAEGIAQVTPWGSLFSAVGSAVGSFFGGPETPGGPAQSGIGAFAPGGLNVGSKVVGHGSAATAIQPPPVPGDTSRLQLSALPGAATVTATSTVATVPFWQDPKILAFVGIALAVVLAFLIPSGRKK